MSISSTAAGGSYDSALVFDNLPDLLLSTDDHILALGGSKDPNAKMTLLLFRRRDTEPYLVVKVPTTDEAARAVERESRLLQHLHLLLPTALRDTIPTPVASLEYGDRQCMVTVALRGDPLYARYHCRHHTARTQTVTRDFQAAAHWLRHLQEATTGVLAPIEMDHGNPERIVDRFRDELDVADVAEEVAAGCARLRRYTTPRTVVHGDYWFGNMLVEGDEVSGVVDWEHGSPAGEPIRDVVRFVLSYSLYLDRHTSAGRRVTGHSELRAGPWGEGVAFALFGSGWFPELVHSFLVTALHRLGVPPERAMDAIFAGVAEVAGDADDDQFARLNFRLLRRLLGRARRTIP